MSPLNLSPADRAELEEKLAHATAELEHAKNVRTLIALTGPTAEAPVWTPEQISVELSTADLRVDLWRQVVAELRTRLGLR